MQDEDYLVDSDFDDIKILKRIGNSNPKSNNLKHIHYGEWKPIKKQQLHRTKFHYDGKMSNYHASSQKENEQIHQNYADNMRNEKIAYDFFDLKEKSRVKRQTGN